MLPLSIVTGKWTIISRAGVLSSFQRPSSKFNLRAAKSNRALCASQGLISWSNVIVGAAGAILISNSLYLPRKDWKSLRLQLIDAAGFSRLSGYSALGLWRNGRSPRRLGIQLI